GPVKIFPTVALFDNRLEILKPDDAVLYGVLDNGAGNACSKVVGLERTITIVGGHGKAVGHDGDRLGGWKWTRGRLDLRLAVLGDAIAQFAEDGHHTTYLLEGGLLGRQLQRAAQLGNAAIYNRYLLLGCGRNWQDDSIEAAHQRA